MTSFECTFPKCKMMYAHFTSLKRHILQEHTPISNINVPFAVPLSIEHCSPSSAKKARLESVALDENLLAEEISENNDKFFYGNDITLDQIKKTAALGICRLAGDVALPQTKLTEMINFCDNLIGLITERLRNVTGHFLEKNNINCTETTAIDFLNEFQFSGLFADVTTYPKRTKFLKKVAVNVPEPEEKMLSYREDVRHVRGLHKKVRVNETFSYISIIDTLKLIFRNPANRKLLEESENGQRTIGGVKEYGSFCTGETYKTSAYYEEHPNSIRLSLYQDDVEVGNALSSRAGINKVSCFAFKIQNFPDKYNSSPKSIFPTLYCTTLDAKKHGYNKILRPLLSDLKRLEKGVTVYYGSYKYVLRATLAVFCGDTLAVHEVFNLLGPGANFFCRICTISRPLFKADPHCQYPIRTKEWYDTMLERLNAGEISSKECGLQRQGCVLNELQHFHVCENYALDVMHDVAEGIVPLTLQLVLSFYYKSKDIKIDVAYINYRINAFAYGYVDRKNKPSANFTEEMLNKPNSCRLKQTATQNLLLLRSFPFLFGHLVPDDCQLMSLIGHLINIVRILMSPVVSDYMLAELEQHICLFQQSFYAQFAQRINKSHHLEHYPYCIRKSGSMKQFNCLSFEQKNKPCKSQSATCRNFKNICKSLAKRQGFSMVLDIIDNPFADKVHYTTGKLQHRNETLSCPFLHKDHEEFVFTPKTVTINGIEFRPNLIISMRNHNNMLYPSFAIIREIVILNNTVHFLITICETTGYNEFYEAYEVEVLGEDRFVQDIEAYQHATFVFWSPYDSQSKYISRRFYCQDY